MPLTPKQVLALAALVLCLSAAAAGARLQQPAPAGAAGSAVERASRVGGNAQTLSVADADRDVGPGDAEPALVAHEYFP